MHGAVLVVVAVHRVENFDQWPDKVALNGVVGVMNRAATEDVRSSVWPVISEVLAGGAAPSELAGKVVKLLDDWVADDAPLLDADEDGFYDSPGALLMNELFGPLADAVVEPVLGPVIDAGIELRGIDAASRVDKDLRTVLGRPVEGRFNVAYCGAGDLDACRASLWAVVEQVASGLAAQQGGDPTAWRQEGQRSTFVPGLIPDDFRSTNRPTFQQVLEFAPPR
jgi:hypothetical protein